MSLDKIKHCLVCGIIGLFCGVFGFFFFFLPVNYFKLTVDNKLNIQIDPTNLLSLIVTAIISVYVLQILNHKETEDRVERNLLIKYFDNFESDFSKEIHCIMVKDGIEGEELAIILKKHGMNLQEIIDIARSYKYTPEKELEALERNVSDIRELLSDTPREDDVEDGVRLEGSRILYSKKHASDVSASMGRFRKSVFGIIVAINRS